MSTLEIDKQVSDNSFDKVISTFVFSELSDNNIDSH